MLRFLIVRSHKKGIRVNVQRRLEKSEKGEAGYTHIQLGSFLLSEGYDDELLEKLTPSEILQLDGWMAEAELAGQFGVEADSKTDFTKHSFRVWKELDAIAGETVLPLAKRLGLPFNPLRDALNAYYHTIINTAKTISRMEDNQVLLERFEEIGLGLSNRRPEDEYQKRLALDSRILFKKLLELDDNKIKLCREWEHVATQYGKTKKITVGHLRGWANDIPGQKVKELKKWYISVTIDLLLQQGINPLNILSADRLAYYWINRRVNACDLEKAKHLFDETFEPDEEQKKEAYRAIEQAYKNK